MKRRYDIVIVGGGIAGLTMACCLVHQFKQQTKELPGIALLDAGSLEPAALELGANVSDYDPRVSALTSHSCRLLDELGVWAGVQSMRCADFDKMFVWDGEGTAQIGFNARDVNAESLGSVVENRVLCRSLLTQLQATAAVDLWGKVKVDSFVQSDLQGQAVRDHAPSIGVDKKLSQLKLDNGDILSARLFIAADGANSMMRQNAGVKTRAWDYGHNAIVCTVKTEQPHENTAWQCFTGYGPLAFLPLGEAGEDNNERQGNVASIVWSQERDKAETLMELNDEQFSEQLAAAFEHRLGSIEACSKRFSFPLAQQHAIDYYQGDVVLIGDAAHRIHPLAGQGINLGIKDAECLARLLVDDARRSKSLGSTRTLGRYSRERKTDNLSMMAVMEGFKRLFSSAPPPVVTVRNRGMAITDQQQWLKQQIMRFAMGVD